MRTLFLKSTHNSAHKSGGALYNHNGDIVKSSMLNMGEEAIIAKKVFKYSQHINMKKWNIDTTYNRRTCVFLKMMFNHHGHILANVLPTLSDWFDSKYNNIPKIYVPYHEHTNWWAQNNVTDVIAELKSIVNYTKNDIILHRDQETLLESKFIVPEEPLTQMIRQERNSYRKIEFIIDRILNNLPRESSRIIYGTFPNSSFDLKRKKLFLGRDPGIRRTSKELYDQTLHYFHKKGFKNVYLRKYTFLQQVEIMRNADIVAGFTGSQLHGSMFCKNGTPVINVGDTERDGEDNAMQHLVQKGSYQHIQERIFDRNNEHHYVPTLNRTFTEIEKQLDKLT